MFKGTFDIYTKSLKCCDVDPEYIVIEKCQLKAIRGRHGVINLFIKFKEPLKMLLQVKLLYRSSAGHYQPYLVDMDLSKCLSYSKNYF